MGLKPLNGAPAATRPGAEATGLAAARRRAGGRPTGVIPPRRGRGARGGGRPMALTASCGRGRPAAPRRRGARLAAMGCGLTGPSSEEPLWAVGADLRDRRHLGPEVPNWRSRRSPANGPTTRRPHCRRVAARAPAHSHGRAGPLLRGDRRPAALPAQTDIDRGRSRSWAAGSRAPVRPAIRSSPIDAGPAAPGESPSRGVRRLAERRPQSSPSACQVRRLRSMSRSFSSQACSR